MNSLYGVNRGISVRKKSHVKAFFVDTHAENTIFCQIDIFIVKHGLVRLRINIDAAAVDEIRENSPKEGAFRADGSIDDFPFCQLLVN